MKKLFVLALSFVSYSSWSQVISPTATEVEISYEASFVTNAEGDDETLADDHASHIFGILQSPSFVESNHVDSNLVGGLGAPRLPQELVIESAESTAQGREITYSVTTRLLLHKKAANAWLRKGFVQLPLPYALDEIYAENCTDEHYNTLGDYWYFYDVYRHGCEYLQREPYARKVKVQVTPVSERQIDSNPHLDLIRGANGNGADFVIYVIHGFNESTRKHDEGRINYQEFNDDIEARDFTKVNIAANRREKFKRLKTYEKFEGDLHIVIHSLLVDTAIESKSTVFAEFFKEAAEQGDFILYAGHSGLGGNLDVPSLEDKAGEFIWNKRKKQIFYFDSCSSYSYYLESFKQLKTRKSVDIITNGLSSYFETSAAVHGALMDILLDPNANPDWNGFLKAIEAPLEGGSYLVNVGGI